MAKKAILVVSFGTSVNATREKTIDRIEADIQKAKRIIEKILREDADSKSDTKEMVVFVDELADSAVIMGLRVWVSTERYWPTKWRLNQKIKEEFDANGIVIPYNQMEVYVHQQK